MATKIRLIGGLLAGTLVVVAAANTRHLSPSRRTTANSLKQIPTSGLTIAPRNLDLGTVWETVDYKHELTITNHRPSEVRVQTIGGSCSCTQISPTQFTIPAGESRRVQLILNLTEWATGRIKTESSDTATFSTIIWCTVNDEAGFTNREEWSLRADVQRPISSPLSARFRKTKEQVGQSGVTISPIAIEPAVSTFRVECDLSDWTAAIAPLASSTDRFSIILKPTAALNDGIVTGRITVHGKSNATEQTTSHIVQFTVEIVPDVKAVPESVEFGVVELGESPIRIVSLTSISQRSFAIRSIHTQDPNLQLRLLDSKTAFQVAHHAPTPGEFRSTVRVKAEYLDTPSIAFELEVPIIGHVFKPVGK